MATTITYIGKDSSLVRKRLTLPQGVPVEVDDDVAEILTGRDDVEVAKPAKAQRPTSKTSDDE